MFESVETPTSFRPRRLGHANLWVTDLRRSEAFYNEVCGLTIEFWEPDLCATFLGTGNTPHDLGMIETTGGKARYGRNGLLQIPEGVGVNVGLGHLAWELENERELVEGYRRARDAGVRLDITVDHQVAHSVYLFDPDDNYMEYYCDTVKNWRDVLHGEMELITSCWDPDQTQPFSEGRYYEENPEIRVVDEAAIHPMRVTHAVLMTRDLDRLASFYGTVGGLEEVYRSEQVVYLRGSVTTSPYHLGICQGSNGMAGYHHVSFELESEAALQAAVDELRKRQIEITHSIDDDRKHSIFLEDPDGLRAEYYVRRSERFPEDVSSPFLV